LERIGFTAYSLQLTAYLHATARVFCHKGVDK